MIAKGRRDYELMTQEPLLKSNNLQINSILRYFPTPVNTGAKRYDYRDWMLTDNEIKVYA